MSYTLYGPRASAGPTYNRIGGGVMLMARREATTRGGFAVRRHGGRTPDAGRVLLTALKATMNRLPGWKQQCLEIPAMIQTLSLPRERLT